MSRQYFDFSALVNAYENQFTVITHNAGYDERGVWQAEREQELILTGAIIGFKESKVFRSSGAITAKDKRLFMLKQLPCALAGTVVRYNGQEYMIESENENAEFTGVYSYLLRWVKAFDTL